MISALLPQRSAQGASLSLPAPEAVAEGDDEQGQELQEDRGDREAREAIEARIIIFLVQGQGHCCPNQSLPEAAAIVAQISHED